MGLCCGPALRAGWHRGEAGLPLLAVELALPWLLPDLMGCSNAKSFLGANTSVKWQKGKIKLSPGPVTK